jgi:dTDP-glucose 4,6-dehydratase
MDVILVTGGAGFIGCNFVRLVLSQTRLNVVVLDKLTYAGNLCSLETVAQNPRFTFVEGDISDRNCVDAIIRQHRLLGRQLCGRDPWIAPSHDPRPFVNTNLWALELLEASRQHWMSLDSSARSAFRVPHFHG